MRWLLLLALCTLGSASTLAANLQVLPATVPLTGPKASQRLVVVSVDASKRATADRTAQAKFVSSAPQIVRVDPDGTLHAIGDGSATVTATTPDGQTARTAITVTGTKQPTPPSFQRQVQAVLTRNACNSGACHGALAGKGGLKLSLRGYDSDSDYFALTRQVNGRRIDRQEPAESLVLKKAVRALPHGGGKRIEDDSADYRVLLDWIAADAPASTRNEPELTRLEVVPAAAVLPTKANLQVLVRAWYSDGHAEDVTHWARFGSSEESVATVNDEGHVTIAGAGEAAITVVFGNRVATADVRVPYAQTVPEATFATAPRYNFIDDGINRKLRELNIPPSPLCSDNEFIRRVFLDAAGILPTPAEVEAFVADQRADKRARLIDALLTRTEFTDYWAYKWSDLLLVSTRRLPQPAMWAFYRGVRQAVADNVPWDQFARQILTAQGSTLHNGLANYFVLHKDVADLTEATAVTFLGMSLTCARCHNHPLEKWTQDQYWSFASLFSRVGMKNGDRVGEVIVSAIPIGEMPHPRTGVPMPPTPLDGVPLAPGSSLDRRRYFADWLTKPDNPYFAKALVNRVWRNYFGRGLVEAEDDLRATNPPSNQELFDAVTADFVQHQFDLRHLMRTILRSAAYQRSATPVPGNASDDRFYSRYLVRRLSAEVILDAYSQVTDAPTPFTQIHTGVEGQAVAKTDSYPLGMRAMQLPDSRVTSRFLDAFGRPDRTATCACERQQDASVGQALHLNNGQTLNDKLRIPKGRIDQWLTEKVDDRTAIRRLFLIALCRAPSAAEDKSFHAMLAGTTGPARREALEDLFWAVLTGREFLFNR